MEIQDAIKVIRAMATGLNPETGEALKSDEVCRSALAVKALNRSVAALLAQEERELNKPTSAGKYWSRAEEAKVCEEMRSGMDLTEIAKLHNRTVPSIITRLVKLGKIAPPKSGPLFPDKAA